MLNTANVVGLVGLKTIASLSHCVSTFVLHYGHYAALFLIKKTCRLSPGPYNGPGYSVPPSWCHWWQTMVKKRTYLTGAEPRPTERDPPARNGKRRTSRRSSMPSCKQVTTGLLCQSTTSSCHHQRPRFGPPTDDVHVTNDFIVLHRISYKWRQNVIRRHSENSYLCVARNKFLYL